MLRSMSAEAAEALQAYAGIALVFLTFLTLLVLVRYTFETIRLRKAAQTQNRIPLLPIVALSLDVHSSTFSIRNFGKGSAFNVVIRPLSGRGEASVRFEHPDMLAPGEERSATPILCRPLTGRTVPDLLVIRDELRQACPAEVRVTYRSASGRDYWTEQRITRDAVSGDLVIQYVRQPSP